MAGKGKDNFAPRINNRRALHEYAIDARLECGMSLVGSEVKSLRMGLAQLHEAYVRVEYGKLILYNCHIDRYLQASILGHEPRRDRVLLAHKREIKKLEAASAERGVALIPLAIYFKGSRAKVEVAVARGRKQHDKRDAIRKKEQDRELRRVMSRRS